MKIYAQNKMIPEIIFLGMVEKEDRQYITINGEKLFKNDYKIEVLVGQKITWYYFECQIIISIFVL